MHISSTLIRKYPHDQNTHRLLSPVKQYAFLIRMHTPTYNCIAMHMLISDTSAVLGNIKSEIYIVRICEQISIKGHFLSKSGRVAVSTVPANTCGTAKLHNEDIKRLPSR